LIITKPNITFKGINNTNKTIIQNTRFVYIVVKTAVPDSKLFWYNGDKCN